MSLRHPVYVLFAGVNGAGKSTLYSSGMWTRSEEQRRLPWVNSDEILVEQGGDWSNDRNQVRAGREALARIHAFLGHRVSFNQETTLAGRTVLRTMRQARARGYRVIMYYIGLETSELANERIRHRVGLGGHGIDARLVEERWHRSIAHLWDALPLCDELYLFDNSDVMSPLARCEDGEVKRVYAKPSGLSWFEGFI